MSKPDARITLTRSNRRPNHKIMRSKATLRAKIKIFLLLMKIAAMTFLFPQWRFKFQLCDFHHCREEREEIP